MGPSQQSLSLPPKKANIEGFIFDPCILYANVYLCPFFGCLTPFPLTNSSGSLQGGGMYCDIILGMSTCVLQCTIAYFTAH